MWYTYPKCNFDELSQDFLCQAAGQIGDDRQYTAAGEYIDCDQAHEDWDSFHEQDDTLLF